MKTTLALIALALTSCSSPEKTEQFFNLLNFGVKTANEARAQFSPVIETTSGK